MTVRQLMRDDSAELITTAREKLSSESFVNFRNALRLILTCLLLFFLNNAVAQEVIAKLDGDTVTAIADSSTLESLLTEIFEVSEVSEVELGDLQFRVVANNIYLTSRGKTEEGNDVTLARSLNQRDGSLYQGSTAHVCTGTPCQECYFTGNVFTGEIEGCGCSDASPAGQVSHTIVEFE